MSDETNAIVTHERAVNQNDVIDAGCRQGLGNSLHSLPVFRRFFTWWQFGEEQLVGSSRPPV